MINFLGIIVARKHSQRIKNKNLKKLGKKRLIEYTFSAIKNSKKLDDIILSTDDDRIIQLAKKYNIHAPFKRPGSLSKSNTQMSHVVEHALLFYRKLNNKLPKNFIIFQPTSPFRDAKDIDNSVAKFIKLKSNSLVSVSEPLNPIHETFMIKRNKLSKSLKKFNKNIFFLNGSIYINNTKRFLKDKLLVKKNSNIFITKKENSIDINEKIDFELASAIIKK